MSAPEDHFAPEECPGYVAEKPIVSDDDYRTVPRGLLELCLGVIDEVQKIVSPSNCNFQDDVHLCISQLKIALKEKP